MITNLLNCRQYVTNLTYSFVLKQAGNSLQNILAFSVTVLFDRSQSCRHSGLSLMSDKLNTVANPILLKTQTTVTNSIKYKSLV